MDGQSTPDYPVVMSNLLVFFVAATECAFCGSNQVVPQEQVAQVIKPESLLPFQIERSKAVSLFRDWLGRGFFRPNAVKKIAQHAAAKLQGVYVPFWTFDAYTSSWWTADAGYHYYVTETYWDTDAEGKRVQRTRQVQKTRWQPASGHLTLHFDDVLVPASSSIDRSMVERIYPFDTQALLPYEPGYLSGWGAEAYTIDLKEAWPTGQSIIEGNVRTACVQEIPGDTYRNLHVDTAYSDMTYKHVLFPVWLASYRWNDKIYHFVVNGQSGEVQGQAPVSWIKVTLVVLAILILITVLIVLFTSGDQSAALSVMQALL